MFFTLSPPSIYQKSRNLELLHASVSSWPSSQCPPFVLRKLHYDVPLPLHCSPQGSPFPPPQAISFWQTTSTCLLQGNINFYNSLKCSERLLKNSSLVSIYLYTFLLLNLLFSSTSISNYFKFVFIVFSIMSIARILSLLFFFANALHCS